MGRVKKGKYLSEQAKEMINNCRQFCEEERHHYVWNLEKYGNCSHTLVPLDKPIDRTSRACKISRRTIQRLKEQGLIGNVKKGKTNRVVVDKSLINQKDEVLTNEYSLPAIRRCVHSLYSKANKVPSLNSVFGTVKVACDFPWGLKTLKSSLNDLGFKWKQVEDKRYLIEKSSIIIERNQFIRTIKNFRNRGFNIVYIGETSFHSMQGFNEMHETNRYHIFHAATRNGFLPNCFRIFETNFSKKSIDICNKQKEYEYWLEQQLIPNLPPKSVVIQGIEEYQCVPSNPVPTSLSLIGEIRMWLSNNCIPYSHDMIKPELLSLVKSSKPQVEYRSDVIVRLAGFHTLHLPLLHDDLNPVELIWPRVKLTAHPNNYHNIHQAILEACMQVEYQYWFDCFDQIVFLEEEYQCSDINMEKFIEKLESGGFDSDTSSDYTSSETDSDTECCLNLPRIRHIRENRVKGRPKKKQFVQ